MRAITRSRENSYGSGAAKFTFPCSARKMNMCFSDTRASPEKLLYKPQIFASVVGLDTFWTLRLQPVCPADACCSLVILLYLCGPCSILGIPNLMRTALPLLARDRTRHSQLTLENRI